MEQLLRQNRTDIALVVGNGIDRYNNSATANSWDQLLVDIAKESVPDIDCVPVGTTLTEFYDVIELQHAAGSSSLQEKFCLPMADWQPSPHHCHIMAWAEASRVPVLTTNFDEVLSKAAGCSCERPGDRKFTDYYPWECRFTNEPLVNPCEGFGIWHINGMARYKRSIRLGLSHYMGSVHHARTWLHRGGHDRLFSGSGHDEWAGSKSWMDVFFKKPLMILGLGLEENEVFLRWLLIERARYFKKFPGHRKSAWYVYTNDADDERQAGKRFFLERIGVTCIRAEDFNEIYANPAWLARRPVLKPSR